MIVDFSFSTVIFAMANFDKRKFFLDTLYVNSDPDLRNDQKLPKKTDHSIAIYLIFCISMQGGRSCAGAREAPAEKFGLGRKF